ncbi:MAG: HNH endonuclease signature motif containing protein [Mastigocoleus sp. MO_167.B18]|nr:HNH endonuclease signature motif containing protein [Mastigocoleus sp. MO_167.B18]
MTIFAFYRSPLLSLDRYFLSQNCLCHSRINLHLHFYQFKWGVRSLKVTTSDRTPHIKIMIIIINNLVDFICYSKALNLSLIKGLGCLSPREGEPLHLHHKIPVHKGGDDSLNNLVWLHQACHHIIHSNKSKS